MDVITALLFIVGLALLVIGAGLLVKGASALAALVGLSPLVVGLTVVAFGTSSPELAVILQASWAGEASVGVGNVVGSGIFNILVILGLAAVITPLVVSDQLLKLDGPVMIVVAVVLLLLALDGTIGRLDGALLVVGIVVYTGYLIRRGTNKPVEEVEEAAEEAPTGWWPAQVGQVIAGLALLVLGSRWLVNGAVVIAEAIGLSEVVVGLTVVAVGTSLPEVASSIMATIRGERAIALGNVVGSNIHNILTVLGIAALVSPEAIPVPSSVAAFDIPIAAAVAGAALLSFASRYEISRWEGLLFLGNYVIYTVYLILEATDHALLAPYLFVAIPIAVASLVLLVVRVVRARRVLSEPETG